MNRKKMKPNLEPTKAVLRAFLDEIEKVKDIRRGISAPQMTTSFAIEDREPLCDTSEFTPAPDSCWEKEDAYIWLYAEVWHFHTLIQRPKTKSIPEYYQQPAEPVYLQWIGEEKEIFCRGCIIPAPSENQNLAQYLEQLALTASEGNEHRAVWNKSLRCFCEFVRADTDLDQKGPLEVLFPSKESCKGMELREGYSFERRGEKIEKIERRYILRRIENTVFPIDIFAASEILMSLCKAIFEGRSNSQRSAAEALGFAWLCHAVGSYHLTTREELVFSTKLDALKAPDLEKPKEPTMPEYFIGVISLFGVVNVPISKTLYDFLLALPRDPGDSRIFTLSLDALRRTFRDKGVKLSKRARTLGQITFLTFMSQPHEAIGHRPFQQQKSHQLKRKQKLSPTEQSE